MKVLDVKYQHGIDSFDHDTDFVNGLLRAKTFNDVMFDHIMIDVLCVLDSTVDLLYRNLWELAYLRRTDRKELSTLKKFSTKTTNIKVSLSEAITFINTATPPVLHETLEETLASIENVLAALKTFLMEDNGSIETYISYFQNITHVMPFDTTANTKVTVEKFEAVHRFVRCDIDDNTLACVIHHSSIPKIDQMIDTSSRNIVLNPFHLQMTFELDEQRDMSEFFGLYYNCTFNVNNISRVCDKLYVDAHVVVNTPVGFSRIAVAIANSYVFRVK